ncbi:Ldh family oxidoreductase [Seohaeicola zhoushanensis]
MPLDRLSHVTRFALMKHGAAEWVADQVARAVVEAEATGNRICGLAYLESYCQQLRSGRVDGHAEPQVSQPRPGLVSVDARMGFAQPAFARGLPSAVEAARTNGTAALAVGHSHTATALGFFTGQIARAGMIGLGVTNATPRVAPPGGRVPVIGTNPIAFSVPDAQGNVVLQFDQSTTTVALGTIMAAREAGQPIPEGWARDAEGRATTDPAAALDGGSLASAGGHKGWGLGLMVEILAAGMTGSLLSKDIHPLIAPEGRHMTSASSTCWSTPPPRPVSATACRRSPLPSRQTKARACPASTAASPIRSRCPTRSGNWPSGSRPDQAARPSPM